MKRLFICILSFVAFPFMTFSQAWDTLANIPEGLAFPVTVVLNGQIHVIGGGGSGGATDHHYRYDPGANTWDTLAPVPYLAQQPAGAVLNGKIHYFGGGYPNSGTPLKKHYVYDPASDSWTAAADLPVARVIMEAAVINGKLYALSGQPDKARVDVWDPATNAWTSRNPLPDNDFWYSALVVYNNDIYRFGGGGYTVPVKHVHKYDTLADAWNSVAMLPLALHAPAGTTLGNFIYIAGGYNGTPVDIVRKFDPATATFTLSTPLPAARAYHELVTIDSCIYCVGGNNQSYPDLGISLIRLCFPGVAGVQETGHENALQVFPNPAADHVQFAVKTGELLYVEIFDAKGVKRSTTSIDRGGGMVDITSLRKGLYFYRASTTGAIKQYTGKINKL